MSTQLEHLTAGQKVEVIRSYAAGYKVLIETGLWNGRGSGMYLRDLFSRYIVIELHEQDLDDRSIEKWWGDSGALMRPVLGTVTVPALFWLDAHLVAEAGEENHSPLLAELETILSWPHAPASTILIDDVRMMGREGWPSLPSVMAIGENVWAWELRDDIVRFTPCV